MVHTIYESQTYSEEHREIQCAAGSRRPRGVGDPDVHVHVRSFVLDLLPASSIKSTSAQFSVLILPSRSTHDYRAIHGCWVLGAETSARHTIFFSDLID